MIWGGKQTGSLPGLLDRMQNRVKEIKPQSEHRCPRADQCDRLLEKTHTVQLHVQAHPLVQ